MTIFRHILALSLLFQCIAATEAGSSKWSTRTPPKDITKPHGMPLELNPWLFTVGPTGLYGLYIGGPKHSEKLRGEQVFIRKVDKGSPADGKILVGDVLLGVNGKRFTDIEGGSLINTIGDAIDEAEKKENGGKITFTVWRDANYKERDALTNFSVKDLDIGEFFKVVEADTASDLERYKTQEQVKKGTKERWKELYEKVPIDAKVIEVPLTLEVMGTYSATSPFDCPKIAKIREQAYPHLEAKVNNPKGLRGWRAGTIGLALLASGRPEHVEMVKKAVHKNKKWTSTAKPDVSSWGGSRSWFLGYELSFLGEYYHRTGDKKVFNGLAALAAETARIQAGGGTWGHSRADRAKNYGLLHGPCPGYGAMNQAGGPCFYGLTLAKKAGVNIPLVDDAVRRAVRFNSMVVDKGCVGYGYHIGGSHEDSNGKNGPPGLAMRMVGENYMAQYFALTCAVANTWGYRGGHGDGTFGNYWPQLTSCLAGKEVVIEWMKKARPYYTMARRWDGTFVSVERGNALGIACLFDPTAMYMLHFSIPLAQLYMTGKDPVKEIQANANDIQNLKDRINGISPAEMKTDVILDRLDTFSVQKRMRYADELSKRILNGEAGIEAKVLGLLDHKDPRVREGALWALRYSGKPTIEKNLAAIFNKLNDPVEIVRRATVKAIGVYSAVENPVVRSKRRIDSWMPSGKVDMSAAIKPFFESALKTYKDDSTDASNTHCLLVRLLLNTDNPFARDPFGQGYDEDEVHRVLERFCAMDPRNGVMGGPSRYWNKETCVKMAGPIVFVASVRQINGRMFSGEVSVGQRLLLKHKYFEGIEAGIEDCNKISRYTRSLRPRLQANTSWCEPLNIMKYKGVGKRALPWMRRILEDRMNLTQRYAVGENKYDYPLYKAINMIEDNPTPAGWTSIGDAAMKAYLKRADAAGDQEAQIKFCRATLEPERLTWFRQMAAMTRLVDLLGTDAIPDLAPYLYHKQWRLYDHSRALVMKMDGGPEAQLVELASSEDAKVAAGALELLGARGDKEGLAVGLKHIDSHESRLVRGAAAQAAYGGSNGKALKKLLSSIEDADDAGELDGYEKALLLKRGDKAQDETLSEAVRKAIPECSIPVRRSLYYVLGQIGGKENLAFLKGAVETKDNTEFEDIVAAISWSRDVAATRVCLDILKAHAGTFRALKTSKIIEKRMVNSAKIIGKVPDEANLDFAEEHLKVVRNTTILAYLGRIHRGKSVALLLKYMKLGPQKVTSTAGTAIGPAASGLSKDLPLAERKLAAEALTQLLEYAKVVYMRYGPVGEGYPGHKPGYIVNYVIWKKISDEAGAVLSRIYDPAEEDVEPVDEDDLDI